MPIVSFADEMTKAVFNGEVPKGISLAVAKVGRRKLRMIHSAKLLNDLKSPPGNRLHALERDRSGQHAIRINDQYRVCFRWDGTDAVDVEIADYH